MKKCYYGLAAVVLGTSLLAGCGGSREKTDEAPDSTEAKIAAADNAETLDYNASDYVKLGEYKNLKVQCPLPEVTDEDLQMCIYDLIDENKEYNVVDKAVENGDYVNLDFTGLIDGEEFDGGSDSDYEFTVGEGEFLEDFEKNILGKKAGEEITFQMVFPEDYYEDVAGQTVEFQVTINSVSEVIEPEYTDELVKKSTEYSDIEEYEDAMREELIMEAQQASIEEAGNNALALAVENAQIDGYPQALYDYYYQSTMEEYEDFAEMFGMEMDEFMQDFMGVEDLDEVVLDTVNETMVIQAIAEKEKLTVSDKNYESEAEELALEYGYESLEDMEAYTSRTEIELLLVKEKVLAFLYESAVIEEVSQDEYYGYDDDDEYWEEDTEEGDWILEEVEE